MQVVHDESLVIITKAENGIQVESWDLTQEGNFGVEKSFTCQIKDLAKIVALESVCDFFTGMNTIFFVCYNLNSTISLYSVDLDHGLVSHRAALSWPDDKTYILEGPTIISVGSSGNLIYFREKVGFEMENHSDQMHTLVLPGLQKVIPCNMPDLFMLSLSQEDARKSSFTKAQHLHLNIWNGMSKSDEDNWILKTNNQNVLLAAEAQDLGKEILQHKLSLDDEQNLQNEIFRLTTAIAPLVNCAAVIRNLHAKDKFVFALNKCIVLMNENKIDWVSDLPHAAEKVVILQKDNLETYILAISRFPKFVYLLNCHNGEKLREINYNGETALIKSKNGRDQLVDVNLQQQNVTRLKLFPNPTEENLPIEHEEFNNTLEWRLQKGFLVISNLTNLLKQKQKLLNASLNVWNEETLSEKSSFLPLVPLTEHHRIHSDVVTGPKKSKFQKSPIKCKTICINRISDTDLRIQVTMENVDFESRSSLVLHFFCNQIPVQTVQHYIAPSEELSTSINLHITPVHGVFPQALSEPAICCVSWKEKIDNLGQNHKWAVFGHIQTLQSSNVFCFAKYPYSTNLLLLAPCPAIPPDKELFEVHQQNKDNEWVEVSLSAVDKKNLHRAISVIEELLPIGKEFFRNPLHKELFGLIQEIMDSLQKESKSLKSWFDIILGTPTGSKSAVLSYWQCRRDYIQTVLHTDKLLQRLRDIS